MRRQDERKDKRRSREIRCVMCVVVCFFSKLPDPRIISNFQNYQLPTPNTIFFQVIFCLCDDILKLFSNYFGNHFGTHGSLFRRRHSTVRSCRNIHHQQCSRQQEGDQKIVERAYPLHSTSEESCGFRSCTSSSRSSTSLSWRRGRSSWSRLFRRLWRFTSCNTLIRVIDVHSSA